MEEKYGKQHECDRHTSSDYHFTFYLSPVGKWTGNEEIIDNEATEYSKKRIAEIEASLRREQGPCEKPELAAELKVLKKWLKSVTAIDSRRGKKQSKLRTS